jgi:hypothetical protein
MANLFFGSPAAAMGKTIRYENSDNFRVSAVFEDLPANSSQQFDFLRSWIAFEKENEDWINNWGNSDAPTFIQLRPDADLAKVRGEIKDFIYRYQQKGKGSGSNWIWYPTRINTCIRPLKMARSTADALNMSGCLVSSPSLSC